MLTTKNKQDAFHNAQGSARKRGEGGGTLLEMTDA